MTKVMVIDAGARGHALAMNYLQSEDVSEVLACPGDGGMEGNFINTGGYEHEEYPISVAPSASLKDIDTIMPVVDDWEPDLVEVAQDDVIAAGLVDKLREKGLRVFGPSREAAQIEWDKIWAREFMLRYGIAAPEFRAFSTSDIPSAVSYADELVKRHGSAFFKAGGLYAGKGVIQAREGEVDKAFHAMRGMKKAGERFLVEEPLRGEEFSYTAIVDGETFICFKSSQDNKRVWNGDRGPNTGGMGANSPALVTKGLEDKIVDEIIRPAVEGLKEEGRSYQGILYLGGVVCEDGSLKVVEFNSRWGDPECHVVLPGIDGYNGDNYFELVNKAIDGKLSEANLVEDDKVRVCVVGASVGYPGKYKTGKRIRIDYDETVDGTHVLSAGVRVEDGKMYTDGGRLFSIVAESDNVIDARARALVRMACCNVGGNGLHYRTDIAWRDVERVMKEED